MARTMERAGAAVAWVVSAWVCGSVWVPAVAHALAHWFGVQHVG